MTNHFLKIQYKFALLILITTAFASPASGQYTVKIFYSETCPICQYYTLTINELSKNYNPQLVEFELIFPGKLSDKKSIAAFVEKYQIHVKTKLDKRQKLAKRYGASVVPQCFVFDEKNKMVYNGRIDDSFVRIGIRKQVITTHELLDILEKIKANEPIEYTETTAVGCFITY